MKWRDARLIAIAGLVVVVFAYFVFIVQRVTDKVIRDAILMSFVASFYLVMLTLWVIGEQLRRIRGDVASEEVAASAQTAARWIGDNSRVLQTIGILITAVASVAIVLVTWSG